METKDKRRQASDSSQGDLFKDVNSTNDAREDDGTPVLDEQDLEENHLSEDEADNIEWDEPQGESR